MQGHFQHFNISRDSVKQTMCGLEEDRKLLQAGAVVVLCLFRSSPTNWSRLVFFLLFN